MRKDTCSMRKETCGMRKDTRGMRKDADGRLTSPYLLTRWAAAKRQDGSGTRMRAS
jgi:hypothetical protein